MSQYAIDVIGLICYAIAILLQGAVAYRASQVWRTSHSNVSLSLCISGAFIGMYGVFVFFHVLVRYSLEGWQSFVWGPVALAFRMVFLFAAWLMYQSLYREK